MTDEVPIKVLVMHCDHLLDAGLCATLATEDNISVVAQRLNAPFGASTLRWLTGQGVDVVITDCQRGMLLAGTLQGSQAPFGRTRPRTLIVADRVTQADVRRAFKQGVSGYLTTTSDSDEVIDAVRNVHRGMRHVSEPLARSLLEDVLGEHLTPRESDVLRLAALGWANKVIAAHLKVELGTVKCHMKAVLDKLRAGNRTEAVLIAYQRGLLSMSFDALSVRAHIAGTNRDVRVLPGMRMMPPRQLRTMAA